MSIIEQATKRLEELRRGGVDVPWSAAGLTEGQFNELLGRGPVNAVAPATPAPEAPAHRVDVVPLPAAAMQRVPAASVSKPTPLSARRVSPSVEIDLARLAHQGYLAPEQVRSDLALEFRHIKRPLLANAADRNGEGSRNSLIMITSALPSEGKTFCAINLAMSMAMEVDTSALLVDADVIRPSVLDRLGLQSQARGLMDVLTDDKLDLADVMLRTNVPKLSILPAGTRNMMSTELLASAAMDRLLVELATRYSDRIIILDAPPLLLTTESRVLASRVGQVVVVVDSENTTTSKVAQAFAAVEDCPLVMSILNKCAGPEHRHGYYGYEYR
jgi:protein-tyrosine kinase